MLVSEADPLRLSAGSPSIGFFIVPGMGAVAVKPVAWREAGVRIDSDPSFIVRKLAAVGGLPTFAGRHPDDKDAPITAIS
jgi:hypothetical protein